MENLNRVKIEKGQFYKHKQTGDILEVENYSGFLIYFTSGVSVGFSSFFDYWELFEPEPRIINPTEPKDKNVQSVIKSFKECADLGYIKYQTTTERTDIDLLGWLNHLQEELMDATIYIERLKQEIK